MSDRRLTYWFGPLERRGLLGPVRAGQAAVIAAGGVAGIAVLDASPSALGVLAAGALLAVALAATCVPVGSRTAEEWFPLALAFGWRRVGRRRFASAAATAGTRVRRAGPRRLRGRPPTPVAPPQLRDIGLTAADYHGRPLGILSERSGRRLTGVLACRVLGFSLLDQADQERRLARWGLVLSGAGGTAIRRVQWIERTAPAQGDELVRWVHSEHDPAVPLRGTPMIDSYLELISSTARVAQEHEVLLAIQVDAQRVRDRGADAAARALVEQTERVAQGLEAAEVTVLGALSPGQLARTLRTAFDPYARAELTALDACEPDRDGLDDVNAWPLGARESWEHYQSDGALHATYWIGAWPRIEVSPMFMDSLLGHSGVVRTVSVTFEPLAGDRSTREVEAAVTRDRADRELRARFGQSETARQRQAADATRRREAELAAGHGEVRLSGFVTVTGRDPDDLRRACGEVLEQAARARLELHRLYGQQADAFTFTLPLCRGLR
ncbi:MAG TPA: SCO6880 family protein [Solirubrobacteraceae bacterium]|nr:SCO6880 family protein [Solirubrobacteraceae bacterium]